MYIAFHPGIQTTGTGAEQLLSFAGKDGVAGGWEQNFIIDYLHAVSRRKHKGKAVRVGNADSLLAQIAEDAQEVAFNRQQLFSSSKATLILRRSPLFSDGEVRRRRMTGGSK